jgi:iron-sulfur cluster assembly protein
MSADYCKCYALIKKAFWGGMFLKYFCASILKENSFMEAVLECPLSLTSNAIKELQRLMNAPEYEAGAFLRIGVKGGGCSGMSYLLGFDKQEVDDEVYEIEGVKVLMKKTHSIYLYGMQVNYEDGLNARGFVFQNPNASSTCGCGQSFSV